MNVESGERAMVLAHYYRAMVGRADIWRTRMDATTNWALGATAAMVSFAVGNPESPHYVVFIASLLTASFLFLEARRLSFYHLWQQRVLVLERDFIRSAVDPGAERVSGTEPLEIALAPHLGRTAPTMSLGKATARRLRRIYLYLFGVQLLAWCIKLSGQPTSVGSFGEFVTRADTGAIPGAAVLAVVCTIYAGLAFWAGRYGGVDRRPAAVDPVTD